MVISFFMPLTEHFVKDFLQYLQFQKRYSQHTITSYENDLTAFWAFILPYHFEGISEVKAPVIRSWLASLKEEGLHSRSINRKISTLKSFFKFLLRNGEITSSPMSTIVSPKVTKRLPEFVEKDQIENLFSRIEFPDTETGKAEKLILEILYSTGMRKSELISLRTENIDFAGQQIKILGKGSKERIIPLSRYLAEKIKLFIDETANSGFLFQNKKGEQLDPRYVYSIVKKYLSLVTTIEKKSPHVLRHSFATHLSNNGAELNAIKELLGHSSLAATQIYTHNNIEKLKEVFKKAHPKAE